MSVRILSAALLISTVWAQTPEALARRALELQQSGDYTGAAENYRKLLAMRADDVATHVNLGVVLVHLGHFEEAIAEYEAADKLLPGDPRIALNAALAYQKSGRIAEAEHRFAALHAAHPEDAKVTMLLADCHLQTGDYQRVIELLEPLEAENHEDLGLAYMLGMADLHSRRIAEGQALLDRILRQGDSAEARFLLGARMFESGDYPAAVRQLASAAELNPGLPQLQSLYGQALLLTGDGDGAAAALRKELSANSNDYAANLFLGDILTTRQQFSDAAPLLRRALLLRPDSAEAKRMLAQCLIAEGKFSEARTYAESAAQAAPELPLAHQTLAAVYSALHLTAEAARERKVAESLEKADPGPRAGEMAPDFELPEVGAGKSVRLRDFRGRSPVVIVFGSYSCPNFRSAAGALKKLEQTFGARAPFLLVYVREAHATGSWQSSRNEREGISLAPAATLAEKQDHAAMCRREMHLPFPALVDGMDGAVEAAYNAWPSRGFIVGADGRVAYSTRFTELAFHADQMESVLRRVAR